MLQVQDQDGGAKIKISKTVLDAAAAQKTVGDAADEKTAADQKAAAEKAATGQTAKRKPLKMSSAIKPTTESKEAEESKEEPKGRFQMLEEFYKNRAEDPAHYTYTPTGDLVILDQTGKAESSIALQPFRPLTHEEVLALREERKENIRKTEVPTKSAMEEDTKEETADSSYIGAVNNLRVVYANYKRGVAGYTADTVVNANQRVKEAEERRNKAMFPQRDITIFKSQVIKKILFETKDDRKFPYDIFALTQNDLKKQDAYGKYKSPEEIAREAIETKMKGGRSYDIILIENFEDPERGFLHPLYTKDFSYTSTQYSSVYQAFEVERLKMVKNYPLVEQMMKTRSPRTLSSLASQDRTPIPNSYDLWFNILKAYYQQNTDLGKKLFETGSALFSLRDSTVSSPSDYLNALMAVRSIIAEKEEAGAPAPIERHVITEEEQKKARAGAIIQQRKFTSH